MRPLAFLPFPLLALLLFSSCRRPLSFGSSDASPAAAPAPTAATASAVSDTAPSPEKWCAAVFETNRRCGYMIGNQYKLKPSVEELKCDAREVLSKRDQYIALTPTEIRSDVEKQIAWFDAVMKWAEAHGGNVHAPGMPAPAGFVQSQKRLYKYQVDHCGLNPTPLP